MATKPIAVFPLRMPRSTRDQAIHTAKEEGISLNQLIILALVEKIARMETIRKEDSVPPRWSPQSDPGYRNP